MDNLCPTCLKRHIEPPMKHCIPCTAVMIVEDMRAISEDLAAVVESIRELSNHTNELASILNRIEDRIDPLLKG